MDNRRLNRRLNNWCSDGKSCYDDGNARNGCVLNGFGGISSLLVGYAAYLLNPNLGMFAGGQLPHRSLSVVLLSRALLLLGQRLRGLASKPLQFAGQQFFNTALLLGISLVLSCCPKISGKCKLFLSIVSIVTCYGYNGVIPIGGADMPVVISFK